MSMIEAGAFEIERVFLFEGYCDRQDTGSSGFSRSAGTIKAELLMPLRRSPIRPKMNRKMLITCVGGQ